MSAIVLETRHLSKAFGGLKATNDVSFQLERGARHALIGPNGAGKTTFINLLTGVLPATEGEILLEGREISRLKRESRVKRGLVRTFQINQLFGNLTVAESLALVIGERLGLGRQWFRPMARIAAIEEEIAQLVEDFGLTSVMGSLCNALPYGKQRLLEIALAIACGPKVLLLDEPAAGVPQADRQDVLDRLAKLPVDVSVLLIEHDMDLVFNFAKRISVFVSGALFAEGNVDAIANDRRVKEVYLGGASHD